MDWFNIGNRDGFSVVRIDFEKLKGEPNEDVKKNCRDDKIYPKNFILQCFYNLRQNASLFEK